MRIETQEQLLDQIKLVFTGVVSKYQDICPNPDLLSLISEEVKREILRFTGPFVTIIDVGMCVPNVRVCVRTGNSFDIEVGFSLMGKG